MFFKLILENANGNRVDMTATANQYMTSRVEGLNPPTRHDQHLRLCRHGRKLSEQCLHRKAECGDSF